MLGIRGEKDELERSMRERDIALLFKVFDRTEEVSSLAI